MIETHLLALTLAFLIDLLIGDPKSLPHPVRGMGNVIALLEKKLNYGSNRKLKGTVFLLVYLLLIAVVVIVVLVLAYQLNFILGIAVEAWIISTTIATKGLKDAAIQVYLPLKENDFVTARQNLAMIVGRDTERLNEEEIVRGAVETVAENTSDGVTAPLFYALLGGGFLAILYRAVNTSDSMVGYTNDRYKQFGFAAAKLDDLLNFLPSRLSAFVMLLVNRPLGNRKRSECFTVLFRDAKKHPSPNSGWLEAAMASLLLVQLGGINTYKGIKSHRAKMGDPLMPLQRDHLIICNQFMVKTCFGFLLMLWLIGGVFYVITKSWS
ncbi:adenosylcobinamide-phosphate synthase CbiB [Bacillaceae bacterium IKA-2]|nr:adenosylcobinamide-phosphate synthase CbiB [Bacillaceae bacterium IKA-2]